MSDDRNGRMMQPEQGAKLAAGSTFRIHTPKQTANNLQSIQSTDNNTHREGVYVDLIFTELLRLGNDFVANPCCVQFPGNI